MILTPGLSVLVISDFPSTIYANFYSTKRKSAKNASDSSLKLISYSSIFASQLWVVVVSAVCCAGALTAGCCSSARAAAAELRIRAAGFGLGLGLQHKPRRRRGLEGLMWPCAQGHRAQGETSAASETEALFALSKLWWRVFGLRGGVGHGRSNLHWTAGSRH